MKDIESRACYPIQGRRWRHLKAMEHRLLLPAQPSGSHPTAVSCSLVDPAALQRPQRLLLLLAMDNSPPVVPAGKKSG